LEGWSSRFLLAPEGRPPRQRAVLLLRDVFDYSVEEAASALGMSSPNVKTTHHRARRAMAAYDRSRVPACADATREMLARFLVALRDEAPSTVEALLADDVRALTDGGGEFVAARVPVVGRAKVARFYRKLRHVNGDQAVVRVAVLNGVPALVVELPEPPPGVTPRFVALIDLDARGRIRRVYNVLATGKLSGV